MIGLIPWLFMASCVVLYREIYYSLVYGQGFVDLLPIIYHPIFLGIVGTTGFSIAVITLLAPRCEGTVILTTLGTLSATIPHGCLIGLETGMGLNVLGPSFPALLTGFGLASVLTAWLYARFVLNRAWFRFED